MQAPYFLLFTSQSQSSNRILQLLKVLSFFNNNHVVNGPDAAEVIY